MEDSHAAPREVSNLACHCTSIAILCSRDSLEASVVGACSSVVADGVWAGVVGAGVVGARAGAGEHWPGKRELAGWEEGEVQLVADRSWLEHKVSLAALGCVGGNQGMG